MKHALISRQHYDLYMKYQSQDSEINDLLGECGLDMGEPVKILDVAMGMVKLHGLVPYMVDHPDQILPEEGDIPICVIGLRKGEKLYEELLIGNNPSPTLHPRIMTASEVSLPMDELMVVLERLRQACDIVDLYRIVDILHELPLDYTPVGRKIEYWAAREEDESQGDSGSRA